MNITVEIEMDEDEYKRAIAKGFKKHYGEDIPDDIELDDASDFVRAVPHLYLTDDNTTISTTII